MVSPGVLVHSYLLGCCKECHGAVGVPKVGVQP